MGGGRSVSTQSLRSSLDQNEGAANNAVHIDPVLAVHSVDVSGLANMNCAEVSTFHLIHVGEKGKRMWGARRVR